MTVQVLFTESAPIKTLLAPDDRFSHIHIDLIGFRNEFHCYYYALTIVDRFTRWCEAIPLRNIETETIVNAFLLHWVASIGCPLIITCDRGRQFTSNLWHSLFEFLKCKLSHTCAYHPAANGMCERFNKQLKTSLKTHANVDWISHLPWVLLGIRSSLKEDLGCSSAQLVLGSSVRLLGQYFEFRKYQIDSHFEYFHQLNKFIHSLCAIPPRLVTSNASFIDPQLHMQTMFLCEKMLCDLPWKEHIVDHLK